MKIEGLMLYKPFASKEDKSLPKSYFLNESVCLRLLFLLLVKYKYGHKKQQV